MKIVITGGTSGIGKQLALDYAHEGHEVVAIGRNTTVLHQLENHGIVGVQLDLQKREETLAWFGTQDVIDIAILNAGTCEYIDMPHFDSALVSRVMRANVEAFATCIEGVLPSLRKSESPRLVGVSSSASFVPLPRAEAYGASKAAVSYMMETLRATLAPYGIAVSLVNPGFVKTPLTDKNDFPMPMKVSVEEASRIIRRGIARNRAEIHFPFPFTMLLKSLRLLPRTWWSKLAQKMVSK